MIRPLRWCIDIWMRLSIPTVFRPETEVRTTVLQCETAASGDDTGAEASVVAVDEGAGVAGAVGDGEIDGV